MFLGLLFPMYSFSFHGDYIFWILCNNSVLICSHFRKIFHWKFRVILFSFCILKILLYFLSLFHSKSAVTHIVPPLYINSLCFLISPLFGVLSQGLSVWLRHDFKCEPLVTTSCILEYIT